MRPTDRHALLADPTRRAILDALRAAEGPLDVRTLADRLGLRRNSVRDQLHTLRAAGMVRSLTAAPAGRGRPRHVFEIEHGPHHDPYRLVTSVLADELMARPDGPEVGVAAGERWGRAAARASRPRPDPRHSGRRHAGARDPARSAPAPDALDGLVRMLDRAGFAPEAPAPGGRELRLRACPFLPIEPDHAAVVCGVHLGFIRGALAELGAAVRAVAIEPFVEPGLCVARLEPAG